MYRNKISDTAWLENKNLEEYENENYYLLWWSDKRHFSYNCLGLSDEDNSISRGMRRAYPINCGVCSWYTAMNVPLFDGLRGYENIGPRRKHVKIILLHFLLWFAMRTLGQLWTCKNRFDFRFDFRFECCCICFFSLGFFVWFFTQILHVILRQ